MVTCAWEKEIGGVWVGKECDAGVLGRENAFFLGRGLAAFGVRLNDFAFV